MRAASAARAASGSRGFVDSALVRGEEAHFTAACEQHKITMYIQLSKSEEIACNTKNFTI